jgi:hypothetical protein
MSLNIKSAIKWTRLSCRTFAANAVRLQLHALAVPGAMSPVVRIDLPTFSAQLAQSESRRGAKAAVGMDGTARRRRHRCAVATRDSTFGADDLRGAPVPCLGRREEAPLIQS